MLSHVENFFQQARKSFRAKTTRQAGLYDITTDLAKFATKFSTNLQKNCNNLATNFAISLQQIGKTRIAKCNGQRPTTTTCSTRTAGSPKPIVREIDI